MPIYALKCPVCGPQEVVARMSEGAAFMDCPVCQRPRPQVFHPPQFTEDRVRFFKGALGNGYSFALGAQMPESRTERDRLAKEKGVEFTTKAELVADSREAADALAYRDHVSTGGKPEQWSAPDTSHFQPTPDWAKPLLEGG